MPFVRKARRPKDPNLRKPNSGLTKAEREIYDIYTKAFNGVRNQLGDQKVLNDILNSLQTNNISGIPAAFNWRKFLESLNGVVPTLSKQVADMATVHSKALPRKMTYEYSFEAKDPRAIAWAQTQAGKRVQGITLETQQAIANLISDGLRTKLTREEIIAQLRQTVGLDKRQSRALGTFYDNHLQVKKVGSDFKEQMVNFATADEKYPLVYVVPTFAGPLSGVSMKVVTNLIGFVAPGTADTITQMTMGKYAVDQPMVSAFLPAHINRLYAAMDRDERDSQYASAWRKSVTYLEASGNGVPKKYNPDGTLIPPTAAELEAYRIKVKNTTIGILGTRFRIF